MGWKFLSCHCTNVLGALGTIRVSIWKRRKGEWSRHVAVWEGWGWPGVTSVAHRSLSVSQVHVNLLLLEARMQAALLYALRAITRYMT